jgi:hypothetical protein
VPDQNTKLAYRYKSRLTGVVTVDIHRRRPSPACRSDVQVQSSMCRRVIVQASASCACFRRQLLPAPEHERPGDRCSSRLRTYMPAYRLELTGEGSKDSYMHCFPSQSNSRGHACPMHMAILELRWPCVVPSCLPMCFPYKARRLIQCSSMT